jgi:Uma2 family endonuclease
MSAGTSTQVAEPDKRRWTRGEYAQMADLGWFAGQRVELIDGDIMVLSPQKFEHYATVDRVAEVLRGVFDPGFWVRLQAPMGFGAFSEPEPDISVVPGRREDHTDHPASAALLVEVSDTTLGYDRGRKASLYATVGVADYWIVNLVDGQLEVHRQPTPDAAQPYGYGYASRQVLQPADQVAPLALSNQSIAMASLLG